VADYSAPPGRPTCRHFVSIYRAVPGNELTEFLGRALRMYVGSCRADSGFYQALGARLVCRGKVICFAQMAPGSRTIRPERVVALCGWCRHDAVNLKRQGIFDGSFNPILE
jgi:hypothetical protein